MHNPDPGRLALFWTAFQQVYLDLYGSRLACIAAMEGHAPAAGCMLALSCDYRIMSSSSSNRKVTIGLNESQLGIVAPPWLAQQMMDTVGRRRAEAALALGTLYSPEEALDIQLVDEIISADRVRERALKQARIWARIPPSGRVGSKMLFRKPRIDHLLATREEDTNHFVSFVTNEKVQQSLSAYLQMLASKKKNKKK